MTGLPLITWNQILGGTIGCCGDASVARPAMSRVEDVVVLHNTSRSNNLGSLEDDLHETSKVSCGEFGEKFDGVSRLIAREAGKTMARTKEPQRLQLPVSGISVALQISVKVI